MKNLLSILLFFAVIISGDVYAKEWCTESGYFDTDNIQDSLRYTCDTSDDETTPVIIEINLKKSTNKAIRIVYKKQDQPHARVESSGEKGVIRIIEDGYKSSPVGEYYYRYNDSMRDWFLTKEVLINYNLQHNSPITYDFSYYSGTTNIEGKVININNAEAESEAIRIKRMKGILSSWHQELMALYKNKKMNVLPQYTQDLMMFSELLYNVPVSADNVEMYNNIGFIISKTGDPDRLQVAQSLLEKVVAAVPDRTPAYLNLADVYNALYQNDKNNDYFHEEANKFYKKYIKLMKKEGKGDKIPSRVLYIVNHL